jgi:hypothetical protein
LVWGLKGTVSQNFASDSFHESASPQAPENNTRVISDFFENSWRYSQIKMHHWYQDTGGKLPPLSTTPATKFATSSAGVVDTTIDTGGKFATGVNEDGGKLPPVSMTPVANNGINIRLLTT